MGSVLSSAFFFILTLGVLITFHEFGHYWVARRLGVKVLRFSIGFGRSLWQKTAGPDQTEYAVAALPLGGYVRMLDEREGEVAPHELHRAFNRQPLLSRVAIVAAGPLFNFFLAILLYWLVFVMGIPGMKPVVGKITPDSVAAQGGMREGDVIVEVGGQPTVSWNSAVMSLMNGLLDNKKISVAVEDATGQRHVRDLNMTHLATKLDQDNLMELLGLNPYHIKLPPILGDVQPGQAAAAAGMRPGDRILEADQQPIDDWGEWVDYVRQHGDQDINVSVDREGVKTDLVVHPAAVTEGGQTIGRIGAAVKAQPELFEEFKVTERFGPMDALGHAVNKTLDISWLTLKMLYNMLVGEISVTNLSGPLSIAQYAGGSASIGLVPFLTFLAVVSISLGVLNLLPIPVLDGGHLMYYFAEWISGKPVSQAVEMLGQRVGIGMILLLTTFAFYNDLTRMLG